MAKKMAKKMAKLFQNTAELKFNSIVHIYIHIEFTQKFSTLKHSFELLKGVLQLIDSLEPQVIKCDKF
jgi:uncharacterized protein YutE (UPF0331/DUF86 family)